MMISGKSKPNFWSRLLLSMLAILALPHVQSLENQTQENYSSQISIQQVLVTSKAAHEVQRQTRQHPSVLPLNEKFTEIQPHLFNAVLNPLTPIRAGPSLI